MFTSPAIHVYSQENADAAPKKPGVTNTLSRKPFIDKTVNGTSPDLRKNSRCDGLKKPDFKFNKDIASVKSPPQDDLFFYDSYSYKDIEDNYLDLKYLTQKDTLTILRSYCNYTSSETPPPELSDEFEMFVDLPETNMFFKSEEGKIHEESVEDVPLPLIDLNGFDL